MRLRIPSHYHILYEPPDKAGEETLMFLSSRRRVILKGRSFREFRKYVVPLLDGFHDIEEIRRRMSDLFTDEDLDTSIALLADQGLLEDMSSFEGISDEEMARLQPQLNFFHEVGCNPAETLRTLSGKRVAVIGLGGPGASATIQLAAGGVGHLTCIDSLTVSLADIYLSSVFGLNDLGHSRVEVLGQRLRLINPATKVITVDTVLNNDTEVESAIKDSDFVLCCVNDANVNTAYKVNRVCMKRRIPWTSFGASGFEIIVGPLVEPHVTPCFLCYKMRSVSCASDPLREFSILTFLDERCHEDADSQENLVFGAGMAASMAAAESFKFLTGMNLATRGAILVFDVVRGISEKFVVLRKPNCAVCFPKFTSNPDDSADHQVSQGVSRGEL